MFNVKFLLLITLLIVPFYNSSAQDSTHRFFDKSLKKWEIGLNILSFFDTPKESATGLIVKHNINSGQSGKAIRFKLTPRITYSSSRWGNAYSTNPGIYAALGYEWQKFYGRFAPFYGGEIFTYSSTLKNSTGSSTSFKQSTFKIGGSGFIGAKYYATKDISMSVESHLIYTYSYEVLDNTSAAANNYYRTLELNPIYAFYLNYHF